MVRHFDKKELRRVREQCFKEDVFVMLHTTLKQAYESGATAFSPFEIWAAAGQFSKIYLDMQVPEEQLEYLLKGLRDECPGDEDVYYILLTVSFQLSPYRGRRGDDIDALEALLMPYLRRHSDYLTHMSCIGQKELYMDRRIDLLNYGLKEVIAEGGTSDDVKRLLELWVRGSKGTTPAMMEHNMLLLSFLNLEMDHQMDSYLREMFIELGFKTDTAAKTEIILGDKNVAESGSTQLNGRTEDANKLAELTAQLKQLNGR